MYLPLQLVVDVHEDESWDLDQRDDEGAFGHGAQVVSHQPQDGGQDGRHREPVPVPEPAQEELRLSLKEKSNPQCKNNHLQLQYITIDEKERIRWWNTKSQSRK